MQCMVLSKNGNIQCKIQLDNKAIEQVESFNLLDVYNSTLHQMADVREIRRRIHLTRNTFDKMEKLFKPLKISIKTKLRLLNYYVHPILT